MALVIGAIIVHCTLWTVCVVSEEDHNNIICHYSVRVIEAKGLGIEESEKCFHKLLTSNIHLKVDPFQVSRPKSVHLVFFLEKKFLA